MEKYKKLGDRTETIGKFIYYTMFIILFLFPLLDNIEKITNSNNLLLYRIGILTAAILWFFILKFLLKLLFKPIYSYNNSYWLRIHDKLPSALFRKKWIISLICSLIFGVLFIPITFGISFLLIIPQYVFLYKTHKMYIEKEKDSFDLDPNNKIANKVKDEIIL